ncbi:MAG: hypothetical protein QMD12_02410 [Candidatus Aenigmarchaeota archaeon]|nr:hypothetical protein [Candidatus Aenigmarchaeota archaeon]
MRITYFKILALVLVIALILGLYGISISERLPRETGYFVLPISTGIATFAVFAMAILFLYQFVKVKKKEAIERKELEVEGLEKALMECKLVRDEISKVWYEGKPTGELYNKSWDIARKIIPILKRLKSYETFLRANPGINNAIYLIEGLFKHYHGGERIETKGPYKEMGGDLIRLYKEIDKTMRKCAQYFEVK